MKKYEMLEQCRQTDRQEKMPYEKPLLGKVELFADQVLEVCRWAIGAGGCGEVSGQSG